jgi:hypothetical protein
MALIAMDFAAVTAERLRTEVVDRGSRLLLDSAVRGPVGAISLQPDSPMLQAADGTWMVSDVEAIVRHRKGHYSVRDARGVEFATAWPQGNRVLIELGSERLTWESPSLLQRSYRIQGLFVARTGLAHGRHRLILCGQEGAPAIPSRGHPRACRPPGSLAHSATRDLAGLVGLRQWGGR